MLCGNHLNSHGGKSKYNITIILLRFLAISILFCCTSVFLQILDSGTIATKIGISCGCDEGWLN